MSKRARSGAVAAFLVLLAGLTLAACGSSSTASSGSSASSAGSASTGTTPAGTPAGAGSGARRGGLFASLTATQKSCLASHGVTLPGASGGFGPGASGSGSTTPTGAPPTGGASGAGGAPSAGSSTTGHVPGAGGFAGRSSKFTAAFKACDIKLNTHFGGGFGAGGARGGGSVRPTAAALKTFVACVDKNGYDLKDSQLNTSGTGSILPKSLESNTAFTKAAQPCARDLFAGTGGGGPSGAAAAPPGVAGAS